MLAEATPPQAAPAISEAFKSRADQTRHITIIISKCAAGDHVALSPAGAHATLLEAAARGAGEGTVVLDVAQRMLSCIRATKGGSCKGLDVATGFCEAAGSGERAIF